MSIKKNIIMGMVAGLFGISLVSGGTVAFFSDTVTTDNKILAGTLDLDISDDDGVLFEFENKKPGDTFDYSFDVINAGTLAMQDVTLYSDHEIYNQKGEKHNNGFDKQIIVKTIQVDGESVLDKEMTLEKLKKHPVILKSNIGTDTPAVQVYVEFKFKESKKNQNKYQGNMMELKWTFEAKQEDS